MNLQQYQCVCPLKDSNPSETALPMCPWSPCPVCFCVPAVQWATCPRVHLVTTFPRGTGWCCFLRLQMTFRKEKDVWPANWLKGTACFSVPWVNEDWHGDDDTPTDLCEHLEIDSGGHRGGTFITIRSEGAGEEERGEERREERRDEGAGIQCLAQMNALIIYEHLYKKWWNCRLVSKEKQQKCATCFSFYLFVFLVFFPFPCESSVL